MKNKKQSSVNWLVNELIKQGHNFKLYKKEINQAKSMHKEEIENAHLAGQNSNEDDGQTEIEYYKETFEKN